MSEQKEEEETVAQEAEEEEAPKKKFSPKKRAKGGKPTTTPAFKGETSSIKDHVFVYNQIHTKKWITSKQKFINYASKTYGGNEETSLEKRELTIITMDEPVEPTDEDLKGLSTLKAEFAKDDYKQDAKIYKDIVTKTKNNLTKLYKVLWTQCDPIMQNKIKARKEYDHAHSHKSVIELLSIIESVCEQGDVTRNRRVQRFLAKKKVYNFRQADDMDLGEYLEKFQVLVNVAEKTGGKFYDTEDLTTVIEEEDLNITGVSDTDLGDEGADKTSSASKTDDTEAMTWSSLSATKRNRIKEIARDRALAIVFFMNSNDNKYAIYKQECHNAMSKGRDEYPKTIVEAHTTLEDYKFNPRLYQARGQAQSRGRINGHQFLIEASTDEENTKESREPPRQYWRPKGDYICHNCDRKNQCMAYDCTHKTKENGEPTRDERRRLYNESKSQKQSGQQHLMESELNENSDGEWELELDGDDYGINFFMEANHQPDILVEDLRGKNKHAFNQCKKKLNPRWILIDNCSSVNVFYNRRFLKDIREASKELHLYTNAGKAIITMVGDLPGFGEVYYYPDGIANILSFHIVTNMPGYVVEYHNGIEDAFRVTNKEGSTRKFIPSDKGLYYWDSTKAIEKARSFIETDLEEIPVETIKGNKAKYSRRDNRVAEAARRMQDITNWSDKDMTRAAKYGSILNNPFCPRDITIMKNILGARVAGLQGKKIRRRRKEVQGHIVPVPRHVMEHYQELTISVDLMHVNKLTFLVTISKHIHYGTANVIPDMTAETMFGVLEELGKFYTKRGFKIGLVLADKQFECLDNELAGIEMLLNIAAQDEHVPEIERFIRVIKERARCAISNTPFKKIPSRMVIGLISGVLLYINGIPWEDGVSKILSPMTIVTGKKLDYNLHCRVPFGAYAQIRRGTDNTMRRRTFGAIAMAPMHNMQGGMTFMSLKTGRQVERDTPDYDILPMPDEVIDKVNKMGKNNPEGIVFTDAENNEIIEIEEEDEDEEHVVDDNNGDQPELESEDNETVGSTGVHEDDSDSVENTGVDDPSTGDDDNTDENNNSDSDTSDSHTSDDEAEIGSDIEGSIVFELSDHSEDNQDEDSSHSENEDEKSDSDDSISGVRESRRSAGPYVWPGYEDAYVNLVHNAELRKGSTKFTVESLRGSANQRTFTHRTRNGNEHQYQYFQHNMEHDIPVEVIRSGNEQYNCERAMSFLGNASERCLETTSHYIMTQYGLKAGLKEFGEEGQAAATKEMKQMLSREVFEEIEYSLLSSKDKRHALPILLFLTRKRDGTVKGRACADGRKQRIWMNKEDTRSPTVSTEALFYLLMIDAMEERDVATVDLPGHFLQTPMEGRLILRIDGELALALVELDEDRWGKHLRKIRGKWVIFVKCSKAIYGTLNAALLSYKKLVEHLQEWEFEMNPYDPCVWNKMIKGKQMTVAFHVDDMKISHVDPQEVGKLIEMLRKIYGKTDPMTETRGKVHEYLGMTIDFQTKGEVKITMYDYVQKMINDLNKDMMGTKSTAAPEHLFNTDVSDEGILLDPDQKDYFHTMTARALYLGKRARPDLQTAVAFLCTRVKAPDEHDYKKLSHLMKYLQSTKHLPLILRSNGEHISLYIDGAHAVHQDMKGHVGVMVTGGTGTIYASSTKTKLNTTSSTETEVVAVGEKLPKHIWFRYFRVAQGGDDSEDILYQDNKAAILLANNGRMSCGKGSKHIHIRYFFITDRIKRKEIAVRHCPTKEMIADYYTKPVQGSLFTKFRNMILGIQESDNEKYINEYSEAMKRFGLESTIAT